MSRPGFTPGYNVGQAFRYRDGGGGGGGVPSPIWSWDAVAADLWEDDAATDPAEDTDGVAVWTGSANNLIQVTVGNRPTYDDAADAVAFTGGQYLSRSDTGLPDGTNPRTIELWACPTLVDGAYHIPFGYGSASTEQGFFILIETGSNLWAVSQYGSAITGNAAVQDAWIHIVATYDGTTYRLYEDGVETANGIMATNTVLSGLLSVGTSLALDFEGKLSTVRIYNVCLTAPEVTARFALGR